MKYFFDLRLFLKFLIIVFYNKYKLNMNINYYEVLEIPRKSTGEGIANAFRRLAIKYHPEKNPSNTAANAAKFKTICEAFDVLSDPERKAIYDLHGEYGLKNGILNSEG